MKKLIEKIRKMIKEHEDSCYYGDMEDVRDLILGIDHRKYNIVYSESEDVGDRWLINEVKVYKINTGEEEVYFKVIEEVGRTEYQRNGGTIVEEVVPKQVIVTRYVNKK